MFKLPWLMCVKNRDEIYENTCLGRERAYIERSHGL